MKMNIDTGIEFLKDCYYYCERRIKDYDKKTHHYWQASPFCFVARLPNTLTIPLCRE